MHQESAKEFHRGESNQLGGSGFVILCRKGHLGVCHGLDAGVTDGDAVGVPAKVIKGIAEAVEGFLDIGDPADVV